MTIRRVFAVLLFVQLLNIGVRETLDPDMWWHLRTGELIWQQGIPHHDVFSFTVRDHEWITHEWLSDVLMWRVYVLAGFSGLSVAFAAIGAWAFWWVYLCSSGQPYLAGIVVALARSAAAPAFGVRPQVFNVCLVAGFVWLLERFKDRRLPRRALLALPLLTVVWVNLHSGYLLGVALLLTYAAGEGLESIGRSSRDRMIAWGDVRLLLLLAALCFAAGAVNPNGWRLWGYPFGTLGSAPMQEHIAEWGSPDFHRWVYWPFALMLGAGMAGWAAGGTRPSWSDVLLFLGAAVAGLHSARHIALFAVIAAPVVSRALAQALRGTHAYGLLASTNEPASLSRQRARLNWVILIVGMVATGVACATRLARNDAAIARTYPVAAVDFLERRGLTAVHGYNTYAWGGYLIWRGIPVFVDGRADVYGEFLLSYLKTFSLQADWRKPLEDFGVGYVLVEKASPLGVLLAASGEWREVYADDVAQIFVKAQSADKR